MNNGTILVVDDDPEIRDVVHVYLRNEGYRVLEAEDGAQALEAFGSEPVKLVILDVMMPRMDGIETCIALRKRSDVPIIMLSAKEADIDMIAGLSIGADDYVAKPFSPLALMARVRAQLRRQSIGTGREQASVIEIQDLTLDIPQHRATLRGEELSLTPLEFAILELLATHRGQVFHADQIYERVWKEARGFGDNTVMVHIRNIRDKLGDHPRDSRYIKTVWGVGYKIEK